MSTDRFETTDDRDVELLESKGRGYEALQKTFAVESRRHKGIGFENAVRRVRQGRMSHVELRARYPKFAAPIGLVSHLRARAEDKAAKAKARLLKRRERSSGGAWRPSTATWEMKAQVKALRELAEAFEREVRR